jgi:hypothetical protein
VYNSLSVDSDLFIGSDLKFFCWSVCIKATLSLIFEALLLMIDDISCISFEKESET